jgi:hypothetical protein
MIMIIIITVLFYQKKNIDCHLKHFLKYFRMIYIEDSFLKKLHILRYKYYSQKQKLTKKIILSTKQNYIKY